MSTEHKNEESIFYTALKLKSQAERNAYLKAACGGDNDLLNRIKALLKAHDVKDSFLEAPAVEPDVTLDGPAIEGPGTKIGHYELLELIGEGGMGLVYLAEQKEPVKRRVALKIIKPGMDSRQVIARFEAERQVLALLDHPNIAHVLDAGTTETGRLYFVMEHVKGLPITQYCDQNKLSIEQRLKLFRQVCEGVHHAHQKGIIHRDLKPSNVLVSVHDDRVVPKIIDFGIAKATTQPLTDKTVFTYQGQLLGTPEYMSPEQVDLAMQDIDIRSDIYSLGVVLYELLAGVLPFERESLARLGFAEVQRTIREQEPASPSIRLSGLGEQAKAIAESRRTQVVPLARCLHRELEWIPLKAMRKDRCRRYRSAAELADDVQNYLDGNPLTAGPETAVYRVKKFVRRHAGSVATAALIAVTILIGLVISTAMYFRAEDARQKEAAACAQAEQATKKEAAARAEAEQAKEKETIARTQAEQAEQTTKEKSAELRRSLYVRNIQLADAKYREGNPGHVRELLASCPNDLRGWEWDRLNYIQDQSISTLRAHQDGIWDAAFSPDGKRIIAGGRDGTIKVWDVQTGAETMTLRRHQDWISSVAFSPDGQRIVSGSADKTIMLWDAQTGAEVMTMQGHGDWVRSVAFSPDGKLIASGSDDKTIKLWYAQSSAELRTLRGHQDSVTAVAFSPNGQRIVSCDDGNVIKTWDTQTGGELLTVPLAGRGSICSVVFSPDGRKIASGCGDGAIRICDAQTGDAVANITGHDGWISSVIFSPDGELIASAGYDNMVKVWDAQTGEKLRAFPGHDWSVCSVSFSPDGKYLMSASEDDTIKLWDVMIDRESTKVHGHFYAVFSLAFSPDGKQVASCSWYSIKLWDGETGEVIRTIRAHRHFPRSVAFSPDGKSIASAGWGDNAIRIWDIFTGTERRALRGHADGITCIMFSRDGKYIISGSDDKTIKLWDAASGSEVMTFQGHKDYVRSVAFSPDGKHIISGSDDKTIKLWDVATGSEVVTSQGGTEIVQSVAFSPDGRRIVSAEGKEIKIRNVLTGTVLMTMRGHANSVRSVAFSSDGNRIISGSIDGTAKLWDSITGDELVTFLSRSGVNRVAFSPDNAVIAGGTFDGNVVLWRSRAPAGGYEPQKSAESARKLVEKLYDKSGFYRDIISELQSDVTLDSAVRKAALQIANSLIWEDVIKLTNEAWATVSLPDKDITLYQAALEKASNASALEPSDPDALDVLGAAQYRVDLCQDALKTLGKAERILSNTGEEPDPVNMAFMALTLHKLGRTEEAKTTLDQLRELCQERPFSEDMELQSLLAEAEELLSGGQK